MRQTHSLRHLPLIALALVALGPSIAAGQSSPGYRLEQPQLNGGGTPTPLAPTSGSYSISTSAIDGGPSILGLSSSNYQLESGPSVGALPPTEVLGLRFTTETVLAWEPERSTGSYRLYSGRIADLASGSGACTEVDIASTATTVTTTPSPGDTLFYLVAATNRLAEEGTLGKDSNGVERSPATPCP